jgi:hypothetical protein
MKKRVLGGMAAIATVICATVFAFDLNLTTSDDNSFAIRNAELLAHGGITITTSCEGSGTISCPITGDKVDKVTRTEAFTADEIKTGGTEDAVN